MRRTLLYVCLAALLVVLATPPAAAQVVDEITFANWFSLENGNSDNMATGRYNTLHTVYQDNGVIKYATSADGDNWSLPSLISSTSYISAYPAITVDSAGTAAVVFVAHHNSSTDLGKIYYAFKPLGATSWTVCEIITHGTQPDIQSDGQTVHVTWTTFDRIQYLSFSTQAPPAAPVTFGEEIDVDTCPDNRLVRPSVTITKKPCQQAVARVAYLVEFDSTGSTDPLCASAVTKVGPRVCVRDPGTSSWGLEWSDVVTATGTVEAVSLSMNGRRDGHNYLAWSDVSGGTARTRIARGQDAAWAAVAHDAQKNHVHVQPRTKGSAGKFRFAWVGEGPYPGLPFIDSDAFHRSGNWAAAATPSWIDPSPVQIDWILIGRPQAEWWGKCSSGSYSRIRALVEAEGVCSTSRLATDYESGLSCPPIEWLPSDPCHHVAELHKAVIDDDDFIDTTTVGTLLRRGENYAVYDAGGKGATVTVRWTGRLVDEWDGGMSFDGEAGLSVEGEGIEPRIVDDGELREYDGPYCSELVECTCEEDKGVSPSR